MLTAENLDSKIKKFWPKDGPSTQEIKKYLKKYSKEKIVIKCGGRVLLDPILFENFIKDVVTLKKLGLTPLLVHGGGLGIKKKLDESNIKSNFIRWNICHYMSTRNYYRSIWKINKQNKRLLYGNDECYDGRS